MSKTLEYIKHKTYDPNVYYKQFDKDIPNKSSDNGLIGYAKRTAVTALPLLSLHKPFSGVISLATNSVRSVCHLSLCFESIRNGDSIRASSYELFQLALSVTALAACIFNFTIGLYVITSVDILTSLKELISELAAKNHSRAFEEALSLTTSSLYLAMLVLGSLEVALAFFVIQALHSFYLSKSDFNKGRYIEAFGKALMGFARGYQAKQQVHLIQKRRRLLKMKKLYEFIESIKKGKKIDDLYDHPIIQLAQMGDQHVVIDDGNGNMIDFGAHFFGLGKGVVKGMNVRVINKGENTEIEFKINHVFRDKLQKRIEHLLSLPHNQVDDSLKIFGSHAKAVRIKKEEIYLDSVDFFDSVYKINALGIGTITVGADLNMPVLRDTVTVKLSKNKTLFDMHELLSFLDLENALRKSSAEDLERMKVGHLFRIFYPREATPFERSNENYDLPLEEYKKEIIKRSPKMKEVMSKYLDKMELAEVMPGKLRYHVRGLSDEIKSLGVKGLTSEITGVYDDSEVSMSKRLTSIMKLGMLSTESRVKLGIGEHGLGGYGADYLTGGAESVYTQAITDKIKDKDDYMYSWFNDGMSARINFSPKVLESGTYQYHDDNFGTKLYNEDVNYFYGEYKNRPSIFEFAKEEAKNTSYSNEVMIKDRIDSKYISSILLDSEQLKQQVIRDFRRASIIQKDAKGNETINGKTLDQFLLVGNQMPTEIT